MADSMENYDIKNNRQTTYADYSKWESNRKYELLDGIVYEMASPTVEHQTILGNLFNMFFNWLKDKPCRVFAVPLDVRLFPKMDLSDKIVVQPDLFVVCNKEKIDKKSINGAPDFIIEILSPSNTSQEMLKKFQYYQKSGVKEYWIIDPDDKKVQVNIFENEKIVSSYFLEDESVPVTVLPGLNINLKDIWN